MSNVLNSGKLGKIDSLNLKTLLIGYDENIIFDTI